jgi:hypothetical protein
LKEKYGIIYVVRNKINNKLYIGQTVDKYGFNGRYKYSIENHTQNKHLKYSIKKYGIENFEIIEEFDIAYSQEELNKLEDMYIKIYNTTNDKYGYNKRYGGRNGKLTKEQRDNLKRRNLDENKWVGVDNPKARKVICVTTNKIFDTATDGGNYYNANCSNISACCNGNIKTLVCYDENNNKIITIWMHLDEYNKLNKKEIGLMISERLTNPHFKPVICLNTKEKFNTAKEASIKYDLIDTNIIRCCKNGYKHSGSILDEYGNKINLVWMYLENYYQLSDNEINKILEENHKVSTYNQVICTTTNKRFNSEKEAINFYNIKSPHIYDCCKGKIKYSGRLEDGTPLFWQYYRDYKKENDDNEI